MEQLWLNLADSDAVIEGEDGELRAVMARLAKHGGADDEDAKK